jgi:hypothetical protein
MNDNRWLYFIVGGLLVVALIFFGVFRGDFGRGGEDGGATRIESSASPGAAPAGSGGAAAGEGSGGGSSTSVTVEQKKE